MALSEQEQRKAYTTRRGIVPEQHLAHSDSSNAISAADVEIHYVPETCSATLAAQFEDALHCLRSRLAPPTAREQASTISTPCLL